MALNSASRCRIPSIFWMEWMTVECVFAAEGLADFRQRGASQGLAHVHGDLPGQAIDLELLRDLSSFGPELE